MGKLSKEEQAQLDALTAKANEPDNDDQGDDSDDDGIIVLRGRRADSLVEQLFGTGKKKPKKQAPADDDDQGEPDNDDDQGEPDDDPKPPSGHRFFGGGKR